MLVDGSGLQVEREEEHKQGFQGDLAVDEGVQHGALLRDQVLVLVERERGVRGSRGSRGRGRRRGRGRGLIAGVVLRLQAAHDGVVSSRGSKESRDDIGGGIISMTTAAAATTTDAGRTAVVATIPHIAVGRIDLDVLLLDELLVLLAPTPLIQEGLNEHQRVKQHHCGTV